MNDTSRMLQDLCDRLLGEQCTRALRVQAESGTWPADLWAQLERAGLPQSAVPEELGGAGASLAEAMVVARCAGRHAVPVPLVESVLGNWLLAGVGQPPLAGPIAISAGAPGSELALTHSAAGGWRLSGRMALAPWGAHCAHAVLVAATPDGGDSVLAVATADAAVAAGTSVALEPRDQLVFDNVAVSGDAVERGRGHGHAGELLVAGALARCHQMVGAMEWTLEQSVDYVRDRAQFGKPIGAFQAVQHLVAELAGHVSAAAAAADAALPLLDTPERDDAVALAKARVGEAAGHAAAIAHQVHGAMGYSHEYPLHFRTRRLWSWRDEFGSERYWQIRMGRKVSARGSGQFWRGLTGVH